MMADSGDINPVLPGFHPDPSICKVVGPDGPWYYLVTSTFEYLPGLPIHRSRNLLDWELVGHAIHRAEQLDLTAVGDSQGLFAPTIRHDGNRFIIVCTLVGKAERRGNFVVTASEASGPWSDPVWWEGDGIDPSVFMDDDGRWWAHGTRPARQPQWDQQTEVWVREMDPRSLALSGDEHVVWTGAVTGAVWAEGPHLYRRKGYVYLLASEGGTSFHHAVSVARADSPTGPYTGCKGNPIFSHRHLGRRYPVANVGHADLVEDESGQWWSVVLASRPVDGVDLLGRETFLVPVEWEDDWPVFAPGVGTITPNPARAVGTARTERSDDDLLAVRRHPDDFAEVDGRTLTLRAGAGLDASLPSFVGRRLTQLRTRIGVTLEEVPDGVAAGLALRFDSRVWAALLVEATSTGALVRLISSDADGRKEIQATEVEGGPSGRLRFDVDELTASATWTPSDGDPVEMGVVSLDQMGAAVSGGFVGVTYGVLAEGEGMVTATNLGQG